MQAQVAKRGNHVLLDVEVSGTPEPVVTWYKNGVGLDVVVEPDSGCKMKKSGNNHTLVIDSGICFRMELLAIHAFPFVFTKQNLRWV